MVLLPPAPQAGASASSATSAWHCVIGRSAEPDLLTAPSCRASPAGAGHCVVAGARARRRWRRCRALAFAGGAAGRWRRGRPAQQRPAAPRWPMIDSVSANSMNSTAATTWPWSAASRLSARQTPPGCCCRQTRWRYRRRAPAAEGSPATAPDKPERIQRRERNT